MLAEVASGVVSAVITGTGRWLAASAMSGVRGRTVRHEAEIASWFDTYELNGGDLAPPASVDERTAAAWLESNTTHAVLHELLAVRMTSGPESDVERLRETLRRTAGEVGPEWADAVFGWADEAIRDLVVKLEARDPASWRAARDDAFNARIVAVLGAIDRHVAALDGDPAADDAWITRYRRQLRRAYGAIELPDFTRRRQVPIARLYVPPDIATADETVAFDDLVARVDRSVLLGDPGGGKSTAAQVITHRWAGEPSARLPFLVVLRRFAAGDDGPRGSVVEHIEERLNRFHQCAAPTGTVDRLLLSGGAAVIFDGLDELIDTGRRLEVTRTIEQFCEQYPLAPVLVTSRLVGYDEARLDDAQFTRYEIAGFDEERTRAYVRNWFALDDAASAQDRADAFMAESEQAEDLRSNPLMLSLMCILYQGEGSLPRDRPGVYEQCSRLLFDRWDARRQIRYELRARSHIEPALRQLAYWLFTRNDGTEVTERELIARTADYLHERGFEQRADAEDAAREFVEFCRGRAWILSDAGTTARGEPLYTFTHRTFLEYFAAYHLASVCDTPQQLAAELAPYIAREEWEVVAELALQIKDRVQDRGAERFFTALIGERERSAEARARVLEFLAGCLTFVEPPPAVVRDLTRAVLDHLAAGDPLDWIRHDPLAALIACTGPWRAAVADDVAAAVDTAVATGGEARQRALLWLMSLDATFQHPLTDTELAFWRDHHAGLIRRHRAAIVDAARADDRMWLAAVRLPYDAPLLTVAEAMDLRDRPPRAVLEDRLSHDGPFKTAWGSLAAAVLLDLPIVRYGHRRTGPRLAAGLGEWLAGREPPFFAASPPYVDALTTLLTEHDTADVPELTPETFLGVAVIVMSIVEMSGRRLVRLSGGLSRLSPYLDPEADDLPGLPVPARFQELLRRWARGEVDFVEPLPEPPAT